MIVIRGRVPGPKPDRVCRFPDQLRPIYFAERPQPVGDGEPLRLTIRLQNLEARANTKGDAFTHFQCRWIGFFQCIHHTFVHPAGKMHKGVAHAARENRLNHIGTAPRSDGRTLQHLLRPAVERNIRQGVLENFIFYGFVVGHRGSIRRDPAQ